MKRSVASLLVGISITVSAFAQTNSLSEDSLKTIYRRDTRIEADITQTKSASYLLKDLTHKIKLNKDQNGLSWQVQGTKPLSMKFTEQGELVSSEGFAMSQKKEHAGVVTAIARTIIRLINADFDALKQEFQISLQKMKLTAVPKEKSSFPYTLTLLFKPDLTIASLSLKQADETIHMNFDSITLTQGR